MGGYASASSLAVANVMPLVFSHLHESDGESEWGVRLNHVLLLAHGLSINRSANMHLVILVLPDMNATSYHVNWV